jgi:RNA polymerase sigma-70 factor, ECF subfamily
MYEAMERTPEQIRDEWLVLRAQGGDREAFAELVGRWQPRLLRHAARLTGRADAGADVAQESWLAIVQGLRGLHDPACFPRWAYQILTNRAADWARRRSRQRQLTEPIADPMSDENDSTSGELAGLRAAIRLLPAERRTLLAMHYVDGLSVGEIAEALSIPAGTVKSRLHHTRNELRELLETPRQAQ